MRMESGVRNNPRRMLVPAGHVSDTELDELLIDAERMERGHREAVLSHLAGCPDCRDRQLRFTLAVDDFNTAAMGWSEARSNTLNRDLSGVLSRSRLPSGPFGLAFGAATPLLASLLILTAVVMHFQLGGVGVTPPDASQIASSSHAGLATQSPLARSAHLPVAGSSASSYAASGPAEFEQSSNRAAVSNVAVASRRRADSVGYGEIANDNAMLQAIDAALYTPYPSPAEMYQTLENGHAPGNATPNRIDD